MPILDLYLLWHPTDTNGQPIAEALLSHFSGDPVNGLKTGAMEVFLRSVGWQRTGSAPRPIPLPGQPGAADFVAIVPILGLALADAVDDRGDWADMFDDLKSARMTDSNHLVILPYLLHKDAGRILDRLGSPQCLAAANVLTPPELQESNASMLRRDLAQALAQFLDNNQRIKVFISHTKHAVPGEDTVELINTVRSVLAESRLNDFFDARDLQAGKDWAQDLLDSASHGALLAIRTDRYASRDWCQREVLTAKRHDIPVVVLDALTQGEQRGSFLLDHLPRLPGHRRDGGWEQNREAIRDALNLLVDECLRRALWRHQRGHSPEPDILWLFHAPEPATLPLWHPSPGETVRLLHPDPPLTACEHEVIQTLAEQLGGTDIITPRTWAARGGPGCEHLLPSDALSGLRLAISVSDSPDMKRLGVTDQHLRMALGEVARQILVAGGTLAYGGHLKPEGFTPFLVDEVRRYGCPGASKPLLVFLAWPVHRASRLSELTTAREELGGYGKILCLDRFGQILKDPDIGRGEEPQPVSDPAEIAESLTAMRRVMGEQTDARLLVGGRRDGFSGRIPGLFEEALEALARHQPLYLAAGFGGATADIASALGVSLSCLPPAQDAPNEDPRLAIGRSELVAASSSGLPANGLTSEEQYHLSVTPRASEIAALVALGLGRKYGKGGGKSC